MMWILTQTFDRMLLDEPFEHSDWTRGFVFLGVVRWCRGAGAGRETEREPKLGRQRCLTVVGRCPGTFATAPLRSGRHVATVVVCQVATMVMV